MLCFEHFKDLLMPCRCLLTAVAGGSSVAAVGAVAVEGGPRLSASASVFAVTGRAPERKDRERETYCLCKVR